MNYRKVYLRIISKAIKENRKKLSKDAENYVYYEAHHILPRSLFPAWEFRKSNIVLLTAREHFFCHQLLIKIFPGSEMANALWHMCVDKRHNCTSRDYERARKYFIENNDFSVGMKGKEPWNKNKKGVQEAWNKGKHLGYASFAGKHHTDEAKQKMREARLGKEPWNKNKKGIFSKKALESNRQKHLGKKMSRESSIKKSIANQGKTWWTNGIDDKFAVSCPDGFYKGRTKVKGWKGDNNGN